jgi:hypothetical protein
MFIFATFVHEEFANVSFSFLSPPIRTEHMMKKATSRVPIQNHDEVEEKEIIHCDHEVPMFAAK